MTLTLIARNPFTRQLGLAMASGSDDCIGGSIVEACANNQKRPALVVVQGRGDRSLRDDIGLRYNTGDSCETLMQHLQDTDSALALRQVLMAPLDGTLLAMTGGHCLPFAGQIVDEHLIVAGNMLSSDKTLAAMKKAYLRDLNVPMQKRLFEALAAGIACGGDLRGHASAGIVMTGEQGFVCRVTQSARPLDDLAARLAA